jgi:hypothetical protein
MLNINTILEMWRKGSCAPIDAALDRHDNADHRSGYATRDPANYQSRPGDKTVPSNLGYEEAPDDVRIVQRQNLVLLK